MNQGVTLRMGAYQNQLEVEGLEIDLGALNKDQKYVVRRELIEGLKTKGYFGRRQQQRAKHRQRAISKNNGGSA